MLGLSHLKSTDSKHEELYSDMGIILEFVVDIGQVLTSTMIEISVLDSSNQRKIV